jgi:hypothetical protein
MLDYMGESFWAIYNIRALTKDERRNQSIQDWASFAIQDFIRSINPGRFEDIRNNSISHFGLHLELYFIIPIAYKPNYRQFNIAAVGRGVFGPIRLNPPKSPLSVGDGSGPGGRR